MKACNDIVGKRPSEIIKKALNRVQDIKMMIKASMDPVLPALIHGVHKGKDFFRGQADKVRNIVDTVTSDIRLNTVKSTKFIDDVYEKFGTDRSIVSVTICVFLLVVSVEYCNLLSEFIVKFYNFRF